MSVFAKKKDEKKISEGQCFCWVWSSPRILTALFWLKRQLRPPCFRPVFQLQRFFLWSCFGWRGGEVGRRGEGTSTLLVFVQAPRVTNWFTAVDGNIKSHVIKKIGAWCRHNIQIHTRGGGKETEDWQKKWKSLFACHDTVTYRELGICSFCPKFCDL